MDISYAARQRLRQVMQNIEKADEIVDALDLFLDRFTVIKGNFSSGDWTTIYEYEPAAGATTMVTFSVVGREDAANQAGFKRTAVFYRQGNVVSAIDVQQTDFTNRSSSGFNARLLPEGNVVKLQVKGASSNLTQWQGSIQIEKLGG
jgi:hypothetical protein